MPRVYYPYRPNLQGGFLARFHSLAQELCAGEDPVSAIDELAFREYEWATWDSEPLSKADLPSGLVVLA